MKEVSLPKESSVRKRQSMADEVVTFETVLNKAKKICLSRDSCETLLCELWTSEGVSYDYDEWVSREDTVAFAEARVKEATDKLKQETTDLLQALCDFWWNFPKHGKESIADLKGYERKAWDWYVKFSKWFATNEQIKRFLEEAKQP